MNLEDNIWAFRADRSARHGRVRPLPLTSMMDMLTIILIFLLLNLTPDYAVNQVGQDIDLPAAVKGADPLGAHRIGLSLTALELDSQTIATVQDGRLDEAGLEALTDALASHFDPAGDASEPVVLLADKQVPYETVDAVLKAAGMAGFPDFRFAIVNQEGSP